MLAGDDAEGLRALYDFFHPLIPKLGLCSRVVVLGRPVEECKTAAAAGAQFCAMASHHGCCVGDPLAVQISNDAHVLPKRLPGT